MRNRKRILTLEDKQNILFVVNPRSGVQKKYKITDLIEKHLDKEKYNLYIEYTQRVGDAGKIAKSAVERGGIDVVVAVGGDGTVNEVGAAIIHTNIALGVIPCGSGNGFARHLGLPLDPVKAIEFINTSSVVCVDYGTLNGRPFFCACGVGFDAVVSNNFASSSNRGLLGYVQNTLLELAKYKPEQYEVEAYNVTRHYKAFMIACGNASQYGNNAYIAPHASMRDGLLNVSILKPFLPMEAPMIANQLFNNNIDSNDRVVTLSVPWIRITRKAPGPVHYDGEPCMMEANLEIKVVPSGLNVLAHKGWDGTCAPMPIYRQFYDVIAGNVK